MTRDQAIVSIKQKMVIAIIFLAISGVAYVCSLYFFKDFLRLLSAGGMGMALIGMPFGIFLDWRLRDRT